MNRNEATKQRKRRLGEALRWLTPTDKVGGNHKASATRNGGGGIVNGSTIGMGLQYGHGKASAWGMGRAYGMGELVGMLRG